MATFFHAHTFLNCRSHNGLDTISGQIQVVLAQRPTPPTNGVTPAPGTPPPGPVTIPDGKI